MEMLAREKATLRKCSWVGLGPRMLCKRPSRESRRVVAATAS
jgi:hypothetical protein